jgi:hypothetical protein
MSYTNHRAARWGVLLALCLTFTRPGESQEPPPSGRSDSARPQLSPEQRGTEQAPFVVQIQGAPDGKKEPNDADRRKLNQGANTWFWSLSAADKIAGFNIVVGILQFGALTGAIIAAIRIARGQLGRSEETERAYLSGGGAPQLAQLDVAAARQSGIAIPAGLPPGVVVTTPTGWFRLDINNHGKTKGEILEYGYGWCEADRVSSLPAEPVYRWVHYRDQMGPSTQSRPIKRIRIPEGQPVIYGRFGYVDIFGKRHSHGFIQNAGSPIAPPHASYIEDDPPWDLPNVGNRNYQEEEPQT